ncbi:MAG: hypothetical protein R3C39_05030 [Dehalococcoidia bacterium]
MAVIERIPVQRAVAVIRDDSIAVRPGRAQLVAPLIQAAITTGAVALIVFLFDALPFWLLIAALLVSLVMGPVSVLGLVYNIYGNEFLIEREKQSARWQQGFLGLGIGTAELVPFWRIARIEVVSDEEDELASGQQQDVVQFEVRLVKDNDREFEIATIASARPLADEGLERANRLASHVAEMTGAEVQLASLVEPEPEAVAAPARRRRRRITRAREARS